MSLTSERFHGVKCTFQKLKPILNILNISLSSSVPTPLPFSTCAVLLFYNDSCHETVAAGTFFPFEGQNKLAGTV